MILARRPTLDEYDAGVFLRAWAEGIGQHAHAPYDEEFPSEWAPQRSKAERAADAAALAATAAERYEAYKKQRQAEAASLRARREAIERDRKREERDRIAHEREQRRVWEEQRAEREKAALDAAERRARWLREEAEWAAKRRELLSASAKKHPRLGEGFLVRLHRGGTVRFGEELVELKAGEVWSVGPKMYERLIFDGHGEPA